MFQISRALALSSFLLIAFAANARRAAASTAATPVPATPLPATYNAIALNRTGWTVVADSAQAGTEAKYVLDGDPDTFWHTVWNPTSAPMPHNITIDMKNNYIVHGLYYLSRQDGNSNGNIGSHSVYLSTDGTNWGSPVATGTWLDDQNPKRTYFSGMVVRYVQVRVYSEAGNRGTWTSAAEIDVLSIPSPDYSLSRSKWVVTADSSETVGENGQVQNAIDGNLSTIWHTQWYNQEAPLPHTFTIDQGQAVSVYGLTYQPRLDGSENGNIGNFAVAYSSDGLNWNILVTDQWTDDDTFKNTTFTATSARYFRLTALTEAGNRGPWSSAAEINLLSVTTFKAPSNTLGQWGPTLDLPSIAAAAAVLYDGRVVTWSAYNSYTYAGTSGNQTVTCIYNPATVQISQQIITNTQHDMFCPGASIDSTGRVVVTGGNTVEKTSMFDPTQNTWVAKGLMVLPRGYQGQTTLSDGRTFVIGGSWSAHGNPVKNGEVYDPTTDTWTLLPGCPVNPMRTNDSADVDYVYRSDNHGWLFGWKNGSIFQAGPSKAMNWYTTKSNGTQSPAGPRASDTDSMCGKAVMYDATNGKILTLGGSPDYEDSYATNNAHIITITTVGALPSVTTINPMSFARAFANSVVLPDGTVLIIGGQSYAVPFSDFNEILNPELWNPATNKFTTLNPNNIQRPYHSVALLLVDGTVFTGGGGLCETCDTNHFDAEIFTPPYLFNSNGSRAVQSTITVVSNTTVSLSGKTMINVTTNQATGKFSLIRMGATTHTVNTDQRRISLSPTSTSGNTYTLSIPNDPGITIPGYYMLFALNANGVPSVAKIIHITL